MPRIFSNWLRAYLDYTVDLEAPERIHFWVGVSTIAGALRRRVWIEQPKFDWTPNFYIILVGPAGIIGKSTCMNAGMNILESIKPPIPFGPESLTWQALGKALEDANEVLHLGEGDSVEKFPMSCLTIAASELGTLLKLDDDGLASMLIAMWDGQRSMRPFKHSTISSSNLEITNPWLNIIGCTTPTWLKINFPDHMVGGGLTSRIIFVYADKKRRLIAYPSRHQFGDSKKVKEALVHDLQLISTLKGRFTMTEAAMDWGEKWYETNWSTRPPHLASEKFSSYIARKQTSLHKLSMILSASRGDDMTITPQLLIEADQLLTMNERDMLRVFESIGVVPEAQHVGEIAQFLRIHGTLGGKALFKLCYNFMDLQGFQATVVAAVEAGVIERVTLPAGSEEKYGLRLRAKGEKDVEQ